MKVDQKEVILLKQ